MKKLLFIYNPNSGKGLIKQHLCDIIEIFSKAKYMVTAMPTQRQCDATNYITMYSKEYDLVVASGGDGTLNEITTGLMKLPKEDRIKVGYIPSGTVNDFASSMGLSRDMIKTAEDIVNGIDFPYDIGSFNDDYFDYVAAFGALTEVSYTTPQNVKNFLGKAAYILEGIARLSQIKKYDMVIESDEEVLSGNFILGFICNTMSIGGLLKFKEEQVALDDGYMEAIFVETPANAIIMQETINDLLALKTDSVHYHFMRSRNFKITSKKKVAWTLDGEFGGDTKVANIHDNECAVTFIKPKDEIM